MHLWDSEQFWLKAKAYIDRANEFDHLSTDFAFWSALSIELLARSALTHVHPVLNADPREDTNLLYGCGYELTAEPKSLPLQAVYLRLEKTVAGYGSAHRKLCDFLSVLRNEELHTTKLAFENLKPTKWLPRFYEVIKVLCEFRGKTLESFLGTEFTEVAIKLIATLAQERLIEVKS